MDARSDRSHLSDKPRPLHLLREFAALIYGDNCRSAPSTWEPRALRRLPKRYGTTRNTARAARKHVGHLDAPVFKRRPIHPTGQQVRHTDQSAYLHPSTTRAPPPHQRHKEDPLFAKRGLQ